MPISLFIQKTCYKRERETEKKSREETAQKSCLFLSSEKKEEDVTSRLIEIFVLFAAKTRENIREYNKRDAFRETLQKNPKEDNTRNDLTINVIKETYNI